MMTTQKLTITNSELHRNIVLVREFFKGIGYKSRFYRGETFGVVVITGVVGTLAIFVRDKRDDIELARDLAGFSETFLAFERCGCSILEPGSESGTHTIH